MDRDGITDRMDKLRLDQDQSTGEDSRTAQRKEKRHSVVVRQDWMPSDYDRYVDEGVLNVKFTPDVFQRQAFYFLSRNSSVFVSAHTSSGKTLVAEYAITLSQQRGARTIYTSPIKALSNQKYYDFKMKYNDVGIVTGDVQVNPAARCLIMTTEILRNLVYRNSDLLRDTEFIVFDEVHYINDPDRGVVWEECIIMAPRHIHFVLLSATIPNSLEFSEWVGRAKDRTVYVISTSSRAVPLEHVLYSDFDVYAMDDPAQGGAGKKATPPMSNLRPNLLPFSKRTKPAGKFQILDFANFVVKRRLIPAIFFCFSKRKCEEYADLLRTLNLNSSEERREIDEFMSKAIGHLSAEDKQLPQVIQMHAMVVNGVAVHHGALLPLVKECVEILFSMNLVKVLVATETFAMGVNMPAKCCAFLSLSKMENGTYRYITPSEYTQMSGRAGRRGMDKVGTVIIADPRMPPLEAVKRITQGLPVSLTSQFKLSFGLILLSLRSNVRVEELMRKSYREHGSQKNYDRDMLKLVELEAIPRRSCEKCGDLGEYLKLIGKICDENWILMRKSKILEPGTEVLLKDNSLACVDRIEDDVVFLMGREGGGGGECHVRFLKYPHSVRRESKAARAEMREIFCVMKDGSPLWDYSSTNALDILQLKELEGCYAELSKQLFSGCEDYREHYEDAVKSRLVDEKIEQIKARYNISSLLMIEEYEKRVRFLEKWGFVGEGRITLKGRAAAEIRTVNEVLVTEMIFSNEYAAFSGAELISLLSSMVCEENIEHEIRAELRRGKERLEHHYGFMSRDLGDLFIPEFESLNFSFANAVYDWCRGFSLAKVAYSYEIPEGAFVRLILRLEECSKELINVAVMIGDKCLEEKLAEASASMKRDIVFLPSLYL
jgi:antiviral helicase SKI2